MCVTNDHDDLVNCYTVCVSQMTMMIWLTVTEYVFHKWPWICSVCRPCNQVLSSLMTHHWVCNESNMMDATCGAGSVYPSRTLEFTPSFEWGTCCSISSFLCNVFLDHCLSGISLLSFFFWSLQSMFDHCSLCQFCFWQTSPSSILEDFFYLIKQILCNFTSLNQYLLNWGIGLVVFGTDCHCIVYSSIYSSWVTIWYLQTFLVIINKINGNVTFQCK
jgi:hypothetical protein